MGLRGAEPAPCGVADEGGSAVVALVAGLEDDDDGVRLAGPGQHAFYVLGVGFAVVGGVNVPVGVEVDVDGVIDVGCGADGGHFGDVMLSCGAKEHFAYGSWLLRGLSGIHERC